MTHYICTGDCKGKSDTVGVCNAEGCDKHGIELTACECTDASHAAAK